MRPELELLAIDQKANSFKFFEVETSAFKPYWHYHPELELTLITKGWGTRFVGDSILPYEEGDLVLLGENLPHHWVSSEDSKEQGALVIQFPSSLFSSIKECIHFSKFFKLSEFGYYFPAPDKKIIKELQQFRTASPIEQISQLMLLLDTLHQETRRQSLSSLSYASGKHLVLHQTKVSQTINYILNHLNKRLTVDEMGDITHMVPQSFCRWFKKSVGMSFITFVNKARVERACHDLQTSDHSILEIAFDHGFDSLSHFNRTFKKVKHQAPSQYRSALERLLK